MKGNKNAGFDKGKRSNGVIRTPDGTKVSYAVKHYDAGSDYGINGGKISKLEMRINGKIVALYDRGWVHRPDENDHAIMSAYSNLLHSHN